MIDEKKLIEELEEINKGLLKELREAKEYDDELVILAIQNQMSALHTAMNHIKTAEKIGEWIPCSERLPDPGQRYLVSTVWKEKDFEISRVHDAVYGSDGIWHTHNYEPVTYDVIAWQPLPEPYQP